MSTNKQGMGGRLPANQLITFWVMLMIAGLIAAGINAYIVVRDAGHDQRYLELAGELRVLAQQVATHARGAGEGEAEAFTQLDQSRARFAQVLDTLVDGTEALPSPRPMLSGELTRLSELWQQVNRSAQVIIDNRERILFLHEVARTLGASIPELQQEYNSVVEVLLENRAPADQVVLAQRQSWLAERIARNVDKMLEGQADALEAADQFNLDASIFGSVLTGMLNGNAALGIRRVEDAVARDSLTEINKLFEFVSGSVDEIFQASPDLLSTSQAVGSITDRAPRIMDGTSELAERINRLDQQRPFTATTALVAIGLVLLAMAMVGLQLYAGTRTRLRVTAEQNERNQHAILRLLDELADLADGDLTAEATVTEDFTGAIADSINYTIDQLRVLVSQINTTAVRVSGAAEESQATALRLAEASELQTREIAGTSAAISEMATTIDQVSANAGESAGVAERSVAIANTGAEVVQNTIRGMDNIREQIQETSKRIKRLGESSQEIGDIISLINDIADQTNILALNAAIQASMAGDAGRGFAVVADEVQRLAERSSAATRQIEGLVKAIQSDTNEAVISMEQTTAEVVRGARLAQDAGTALTEIEQVSQELAELIQNISNAARQQASTAGHVANTMNVIQEITTQTSSGTKATARSIGNLAEMAQELKGSVAGFKLPADLAEG